MALRSRLGGEARLQQAICLDSLGRNQEAYDIYKRIESHPAPGVAKTAKRCVRACAPRAAAPARLLARAPPMERARRRGGFAVVLPATQPPRYLPRLLQHAFWLEGGGKPEGGPHFVHAHHRAVVPFL